jgi:flavin-dependent dehydrogenase
MYRSLDFWTSCLTRSRHVGVASHFSRELTRPKYLSASGSCLTPAAGVNWLAVGDAALTYDPISSQGIFSALYTGLRAAETVINGTGTHEYRNHLSSIREAYLKNVSRVYDKLKSAQKVELGHSTLV